MEGMEAKVNVNQIKKEFESELFNAENQSADLSNNPAHSVLDKPSFVVPDYAVKLFCDVKNAVKAKYITKDLDEDIKDAVRNILRTTDKEIKIYKAVLEQVGEQYLPEQHKEWVSKILNSPLILVIENEIETTILAIKEVKRIVNEKKNKEVA